MWFLMGDFLRFSPWSGGLLLGKNFCLFCSPLWIICAGSRKPNFEIRVLLLLCFLRDKEKKKKKHCSCTFYFSMIIVKSLQLCGRRQIIEPRKYCLVRVIVFFDVCFLYFFVSHRLGIWVNSLNSLISLLSDFQWC